MELWLIVLATKPKLKSHCELRINFGREKWKVWGWNCCKIQKEFLVVVCSASSPPLWPGCLRSTGAAGRRRRWPAPMGSDAAAYGSPQEVQGRATQIPWKTRVKETSARAQSRAMTCYTRLRINTEQLCQTQCSLTLESNNILNVSFLAC